nr:hypothetical protein [Pararhizobium arenae]
MLPIGGIGFACIGGTGGFDIAAGAIGKVGEMSWWVIIVGNGGECAIARHLQRRNITAGGCAERRRRDRLDMIFAVLLDDLGHFSIMTRTSDNATLSDIINWLRTVRFRAFMLV